MSRRGKKRGDIAPTLWFAKLFIAAARLYAKYLVRFGEPQKRDRARRSLEKFDALAKAHKESLALIHQGKIVEGMEVVDAMQQRHFPQDARSQDSIDTLRALERSRNALREEADALQQIRAESGEDLSLRIQRYREFIATHPKSHIAYSWLAGTLRQTGDLDDCLEALRTALSLAEADGSGGYSTRITYYDVLREKGQIDDAIAGFREMLETSEWPESMSEVMTPPVYVYLGDALNAKGDREAAHSAWEEAAKRDKSKSGYIKKEVRKRLQGP